jgi:hypothetical protein
MFVQKITITHNIEDLSCDVCLMGQNEDDKILLNFDSEKKAIIYATFNKYKSNNFMLCIANPNSLSNCKNHCKYVCACEHSKIYFSLGDKYKGEIELELKELNDGCGKIYLIYADKENISWW